MADLPLACPAASQVTGPSGAPSVLCGVLANANDGEHIDGWTQRGQVSGVFDGRADRDNVRYFCCSEGGSTARPSGYRNCEIWKAEQKALEAGRKGPGALVDGQAERMDVPPDPRVGPAVDALQSGALGEAAALEHALGQGGRLLGGGS